MSNIVFPVDIKNIDLGDERYKVSLSKTDIKSLANSIKHTGLINPPIIKLTRPGGTTHTIISGFNRIRALQYYDAFNFPAVVLPPETSELECHTKAVAAKAFQRQLTHAELILSIGRLVNFCDKKEIAEKSAFIYNTHLSLSFINDLEAIGNLPEPALDLIQYGSLSIKTAKRLLNISKENIALFLEFFSKIKASSSKQLEIITYMTETAARESISLKELYDKLKLDSILIDKDVPPGVKTNQIRTVLYEKRFPMLSGISKQVHKSISELKLGPKIKIVPPENLEGPNYTISFTSKTVAEFQTQLKKLEGICNEEDLKKIFFHEN